MITNGDFVTGRRIRWVFKVQRRVKPGLLVFARFFSGEGITSSRRYEALRVLTLRLSSVCRQTMEPTRTISIASAAAVFIKSMPYGASRAERTPLADLLGLVFLRTETLF